MCFFDTEAKRNKDFSYRTVVKIQSSGMLQGYHRPKAELTQQQPKTTGLGCVMLFAVLELENFNFEFDLFLCNN